MQLYLVPFVSTQIGNNTVNAPKYLGTSASFSCIPYGQEGLGLVSTAANAVLNQPDVFVFPDLTSTVADNDLDPTVAQSFAAFCTTNNIPVTQFISGMFWGDIANVVAELFLADQSICGITGVPTFSSGVTTDSPISASGASSLAPTVSLAKGAGNIKAGGTAAPAAPTSNGPYDFTQIDASDTVGDTLDQLSQQITSPIILGGQAIGA
jgi:hypothetical protein